MALQTSTPVVQDPRLVELGINVIRGIAMDAPEQADSGHPGTAMALAPLAHVLWTRIMNYDPHDPEWPDHDRFILSNGHACILQYSMLHLTGYDLSLEDLRQFREWGSRTPGHPAAGPTAGGHGCRSTTTTTSPSTGRPSWPTTTTCRSASRPTAGACATWAKWPTTSTRWRPPSARCSTSRRTPPTPSRHCWCCAATSG